MRGVPGGNRGGGERRGDICLGGFKKKRSKSLKLQKTRYTKVAHQQPDCPHKVLLVTNSKGLHVRGARGKQV